MCGIVGFITAEKAIGAVERKRWFINALRAGVVRGDDGTGIFMVPHALKEGESADWCKMGSPPEKFLETTHAIERLGPGQEFDPYRAVIGHNRSATIGSVSTANAHPFQEGPITLVHNGTLTTTYNLPTAKHKLKGADVDSHVICHNLATHSVADVVKELDGAYVLVWHDARDQSVNIIRNDKRPLHILPLKHHNTLLLASEAEMLWWLTQRSNFTPGDKIYYPEPGHLLSFTQEGGVKPKVTKLEMYKYKHNYGRGGYGGWTGGEDGDDSAWYRGGGRGRGTVTVTAGEGSNMGKGQGSLAGEPHINRAAYERKIPRPLSKTLNSVGLHHLDKLRMSVISVYDVTGTENAVVIGRLIDVQGFPTAHIYGLKYSAVKEAQGREVWTVAPCGVKEMGSHGIQVVLVRLLARSSTLAPMLMPEKPDQPSSDSSQADSSIDDVTIEEIDTDELWEAMTPAEQQAYLERQAYWDPTGRRITLKAWLDLTACGCSLCKGQIEPEEADDMAWDVTTKLPICGECRFDLEEDDDIDYSEAV